MLTRIHVNQHIIRENKKKKDYSTPVITVKDYKTNTHAHEVIIHCEHCDKPTAKVIYSPEKPLSCGASVFIQTKGYVKAVVNGKEKNL